MRDPTHGFIDSFQRWDSNMSVSALHSQQISSPLQVEWGVYTPNDDTFPLLVSPKTDSCPIGQWANVTLILFLALGIFILKMQLRKERFFLFNADEGYYVWQFLISPTAVTSKIASGARYVLLLTLAE